MKRFLWGVVLLAGCADASRSPRPVTIAVAASLKDLVEKTAPDFERAHPGIKLAFSFDASSTLSRQIQEGGAYAAFLSADEANIDRLEARVFRKKIFLANHLALVGPEKGLPCVPESVAASAKGAMAAPAVPAGKAWREYLGNKGLLAGIEPHLATADNVRGALAMFDAETVDFAFVYATDARMARRPHATWIPPDGPVVRYAAAVVGPSMEGLAYVEWLASTEFRSAARDLGFLDP